MDNYSRKIYVLPYNSKCAWIGSSIRMNIWINGPHALTLPTLFHELGHTLGLMHSSTPLGEYGDYSCAMGGDAGVRCFNAPQNWVLGWAKPIADLNYLNNNFRNFRNNTRYSYTIPPQTSVENNMIRINFNNNYYFISFRANINYDKGLYSIYTNAVSIHNYNNNHTYNTNNDYNRLYMGRPKLLKVMRVVGQVWIEPTEQLAIRIDSIENEYSAGVSVCHYNNNNLNNISDCNFNIKN